LPSLLLPVQVQLSAVEAAAVAAGAGALSAAAASLYAGSKLALYYVPAAGSSITTRQLRAAMAAMVPSYMLPAYFTAIEAIPLTAHGKIDRAALPAPATGASKPAAAGEAISDETEAAVAAAMEQVLGLASGSVRSEDSFVYDLGANSLSLFVLLPELRKLAADIDVTDVAVPGDDTPCLLAARIKQLNSESAAAAAGGAAQLLDLQQPLPAELVVVSRGPAGSAPVFIVHGGAGNSPVGLEMAQALRGKRTLIAITLTQGAAEAAEAHSSGVVLGLAAHYADAIQKVQPAGPYTLSGVGRGSLIAYEIGRELEARKQAVTAVAALDYVFRPGTVNSSSAAPAAKDFLTVASHMTVATRLLAGGRAEGLSEEAAAQVVAELEQTLAADETRAGRAAAIKAFIATAVAPAISEAALRAFDTLGRAMNYDPVSGRGPAAPLLQAPVVIARAADQEFMDGIFRQGNAPGVSARDLGWHQASAAGPATVVDVPGLHMDMLLTTESAVAMAAVFETL
jgi:thioesterase domain-containing protein